MRNRAFIIAMLIISSIAFVSCGGDNRGQQGKWSDFKYTMFQNGQLIETKVRLQVTGAYYGEGVSDEIQLRVEYMVENISDRPMVVSWEDKFVEDMNGGMMDPFSGNTSVELQPGESANDLYVRYLLSREMLRDASNTGLWWGRHTDDEAGLKYKIRLSLRAG